MKTPKNRYAVGERSRALILDATLEVLRRDGYQALSMRGVARECGMSVGNLTYHFASKKELLEGAIDRLLGFYERGIRMPEPADPSDHSVEGLVAWLVRDAGTPEASGLFKELWVLARHDDYAAAAMARFYDSAIHSAAEALGAKAPELEERQVLRVAYLLATITEGTGVIFGGPAAGGPVELEEILPLIQRLVRQALEPEGQP